MANAEARLNILRMVNEGKISAEEGARLIAAEGGDEAPAPEPVRLEVANAAPEPAAYASDDGPTWLRLRVTDLHTGRDKVTINAPAALVRFGLGFVPDTERFHLRELRQALHTNARGHIFDVQDHDGGQRVEIIME